MCKDKSTQEEEEEGQKKTVMFYIYGVQGMPRVGFYFWFSSRQSIRKSPLNSLGHYNASYHLKNLCFECILF